MLNDLATQFITTLGRTLDGDLLILLRDYLQWGPSDPTQGGGQVGNDTPVGSLGRNTDGEGERELQHSRYPLQSEVNTQ